MSDFPRFLTADQVGERLPWASLVEAIESIVVDPGGQAPDRTVHTIPVPGGNDASLLMKPGWLVGEVVVVKVVTFFPDNGAKGLATINAGVLVFSAANGALLGACDAGVLTTRRTAAASAVAAKRLVRPGATRLLVLGTGALAPMVARAHCAVHDYEGVEVWGRDLGKAQAMVEALGGEVPQSRVAEDLDAAVARADVIASATASTSALVKGSLLQPGTHVDLIGAFSAQMREADDDVVRRATVFVDTRHDAVLSGDLAQPLEDEVIDHDDIAADLAELVTGTHPGRTSDEEVTVFKSVGTALEDVAAARLAFTDDRG